MFSNTKLKHLLANSSLTISEIASATNVDYSTLTRILNGSTSNPRPETVHSLARYFGIDVAELYDHSTSHELTTITNQLHFKDTKEVLNYLLLKHGLINTHALHKASGIPKANLDRILSGITEKPNHSTLKSLADFFKLSMAQISALEPIETKKNQQYSNNKVPLLTLAEIKDLMVNSYTTSKINNYFAYLIENDKFEPDFSKGTTLIVNITLDLKPLIFIIIYLANEITICEFHRKIGDIIFIRKAGTEDIMKVYFSSIRILGVITQEITKYI